MTTERKKPPIMRLSFVMQCKEDCNVDVETCAQCVKKSFEGTTRKLEEFRCEEVEGVP